MVDIGGWQPVMIPCHYPICLRLIIFSLPPSAQQLRTAKISLKIVLQVAETPLKK